jgi:hypothetical protein
MAGTRIPVSKNTIEIASPGESYPKREIAEKLHDIAISDFVAYLDRLPIVRKVYRIENDEGQGPYQSRIPHWMIRPHTSDTGQPPPTEDMGFPFLFKDNNIYPPYWFPQFKNQVRAQGHNIYFGFSTMEQLSRWFQPIEITRLGALGFHIKEITVTRGWDSGIQVLFLS